MFSFAAPSVSTAARPLRLGIADYIELWPLILHLGSGGTGLHFVVFRLFRY
jgi:hypothetical protein